MMEKISSADSTTKEHRIQWRSVDEESALPVRLPQLRRTHSNDSLSIRSLRSRTTVQPSVALPIHYRTTSFNIAESKERKVAEQAKFKDDTAKELSSLEWHVLPTDEVFRRLSTTPSQGLSTDQVKRKRVECGQNVLSPPPSHWFQQIFGYFFKGFGSVLLVGAILVFVAWKPLGQPSAVANLALALVLVAVFLIQAAFNAWQDWSSSRVMASITHMLPDECLVIRDGQTQSIMGIDIVPGDVLIIKAGNKLAADVRFVEVSSDARFDRSILTGESLPIAGVVDFTEQNYLETGCIGMQGTHCVSGTALGVVVATGDRTVFGRIAKLTSEPKTGLTPLEREVLRFVVIIVSIMLTMIVLVIIVWAAWLRKDHTDWISVPTLIVDCVSVAIAFIPEGLPIALTAGLTITANMMRQAKILCKSLKTVETLGAVSVICSDKTGTLTKGIMTVTECSIGAERMTADEADARLQQEKPKAQASTIEQLRAIAGLCNAAEFDASTLNRSLEDRKVNGDATDQAILKFSERLGPVSDLREYWKKHFEVAFNSKNKFMLRTLSLVDPLALDKVVSTQEANEWEEDNLLLTIKGAADILMTYCSHVMTSDGERRPLDDFGRMQIENLKNEWSSNGKRVLLLARRILKSGDLQISPSSSHFEKAILGAARQDLTLVGLVGLVDPPREEIPDVTKTLRSAGIRVMMVTGDFALTAQAIATECGIITNPPAAIDSLNALDRDSATSEIIEKVPRDLKGHHTSIVLSGPELLTLNNTQWEQLCGYDEIVFARTTPEQKLRIVREFQHRDQIVGMTGDGVNDAPSLKAADIGIAIGSGSDIAIEAADMVLLESFSAVVEAVQYGRVVYDNLKKVIAYLLPAGSFSEFWPVMTNVLFGLPQVLSSFLMIIICCFTDCAAATVLCYEAPEADVLTRPPRNTKKDRLVDWKLLLQAYGFIGTLETISSFAMSYWYLQRKGIPFSDLWFGFGNLPTGVDQDYYNARLAEASSIYFINLVVMQWFNLMAVRTRRLSIFQHPPIFNKRTQNFYLFPAIAFALVMAIFWNYVPAFQNALSTSRVPVEHYFLPATFGIGILILDEARKAAVRRWPQGLLAKCAW